MNYFNPNFENYLNNSKILNSKIQNKIPDNIRDLKNIIFYGPPSTNKYNNVLNIIKKYSPSGLKHQKKISIMFNKQPYYFKISDIHYEVDISLLGCNFKQLWHEIYMNILDIIYSSSVGEGSNTNNCIESSSNSIENSQECDIKINENKIEKSSLSKIKTGIILCKNFNEIQSELLENFYSYIQKNKSHSNIDIKFIFICEHISFLPESILSCCDIIHYSKFIFTKNKVDISLSKSKLFLQHYKIITNKIVGDLINIDKLNFLLFRDTIYDIFIYNLDINICILNILQMLLGYNKIRNSDFSVIMIKTYTFLHLYQNNYRPIFHVENYLYFLATKIIRN